MPVNAGTFEYVLAPWQYRTETLEETGAVIEGWFPPANAVSAVELRPINARRDVERGTLADWGFFALPAASTLPGSALDCGNWLEGTLSSTLKSEIVARLPWLSPGDLSTSVTLLDAVWDMLTVASDPAGTLGPRPLMPGMNGRLGLHLQGHSEVRRQNFRWGAHPATEKIAESLQLNYERWQAQSRGQSQQHRKALGAVHEKYSRFGLTDYRQVLPERFRNSPDHRPMTPETTFVDDFNRDNAGTLGANWVNLMNSWGVTGSAAGNLSNGEAYARWASPLSSDDHYSANVMGAIATFDDWGIAGRFETAAQATCYAYERRNQNASSHALFTVVDGTRNSIGVLSNDFLGTVAAGTITRIECEGSTIRAVESGVTKLEITNSDLSGQLYPGMAGNDFIGLIERNSWTAADLGTGGGGGVVYVEGHVIGRGLSRGIARAIA